MLWRHYPPHTVTVTATSTRVPVRDGYTGDVAVPRSTTWGRGVRGRRESYGCDRLPEEDSNLHYMIQSHVCCLYTIREG